MGSCVSKSGARGRQPVNVAPPEAAARRTDQRPHGNHAKQRDDVLTELTHADPKVYVPAEDGPLAMREESRMAPIPWHEFELFRELHPRNMAELVDRMTIRTFKRDELIVRKGTIGTTMFCHAHPIHPHPGGNPVANLKSISHRCHPILVTFS